MRSKDRATQARCPLFNVSSCFFAYWLHARKAWSFHVIACELEPDIGTPSRRTWSPGGAGRSHWHEIMESQDVIHMQTSYFSSHVVPIHSCH